MFLHLTHNFDRIIQQLEEIAANAVADTTNAIAEKAQHLAPVDSSSLQQSVYAVLPNHNGHGQAEAAARRVNPQVDILPPLTIEEGEPGVHHGIVDVAAAHGIFVHNGTGDMAARPFLEEAALNADQHLEAHVRAGLRRL